MCRPCSHPPRQRGSSRPPQWRAACSEGDLIGSSVADAYPWYAGLESLVNCDVAADVLACLRTVSADTLVQTSLNSTATGWVNIEPSVLPEDPFNKLRRLGSPVPLLIGSNSDEEAFSYVSGPALDPSSYATSIHTQFDSLAAGARRHDPITLSCG